MVGILRDRKWLVVLFVLLSIVLWDRYGTRLGLNAENILSIRPGMTMVEVRTILGDPVRQEVDRDIKFFCRCNEEQICKEPERTTWTYTRKPVMRALSFPMLWVHFNSRCHVDEVYAKEYFALGMDSRGMYMVKLDPCDTTDRTVEERYGDISAGSAALHRLREIF
ncbi:MAG: hypothetical protein KDC00_05725 [Flavobacteriales bacterium]|nr:hypothetical protein [Flavobacteriales bacterium]